MAETDLTERLTNIAAKARQLRAERTGLPARSDDSASNRGSADRPTVVSNCAACDVGPAEKETRN